MTDVSAERLVKTVLDHPIVGAARLEGGRDDLVLTVVPKLDGPQIEAEQLRHWRAVYEESFATAGDVLDGWISSYTGEPLPRAGMDEWIAATAERILDLKPQHVVEIGSGTGLLVERIAPKAESYLAVDAAESCQARLSRLIEHRPGLGHVRQRTADAADLPGNSSADTVILNSIVQYFPNQAYLTRVLNRALGWIEEGAIFVGDVRDLRLLPHFYASLARHRGFAALKDVSRFIQDRLDREEELAIDPDFFHRFGAERPRIRRVRVLLKRGYRQNELTKYRYDVVIHVGSRPEMPIARHAMTFSSIPEIRDALRRYPNRSIFCLAVDKIPNARLVDNSVEGGGVEPEMLHDLAAATDCQVDIAPNADPMRFDAVFYRGDEPPILSDHIGRIRQSNALTNNPALPLARSLLPALLRRHLDARLPGQIPAHMIRVVAEDDGADLPVADQPDDAGTIEARLIALWRECLHAPAVGSDDDFFASGGSSLLAMQLRKRIADDFGVTVSLSVLATRATPRAIAAFIQDAEAKAGT